MTHLTGAFRSHNHPVDNFVERDSDPLMQAPVPTAPAWREVVQIAATGNHLAQVVVNLGRAKNAERLARAEGVAVPAWAQEILAPIEDDDETNVDEAFTLLSQALA